VQVLIGPKIHPRLRRGCKVRVKLGVIIDPAVEAEFGATRRRGDGNAESAKSGATRRSIGRRAKEARIRGNLEIHFRGTAGRCRSRGSPGPHRQALPTDWSFGATRRAICGNAQGCEIRGNSRLHRRHTAGRCGRRGNPGPHRQAVPRLTLRGNPESSPRER
jgi:hypothetical protein